MSSYWVMDPKGLVVGPLTPEALRDIATQLRLSGTSKASLDGRVWVPLGDIPELAKAVLGETADERRKREVQEAQRIRMQLDRFKELKPNELFSALPGATAKEHRPGYLALARPYHPGRLQKDSAPELVRACVDMFQYLATKMAELENAEKRGPGAAPVAPQAPTLMSRGPSPSTTSRLSTPTPASASPAQGTNTGVDIRRTQGKAPEITLVLSEKNVGLFCDHKVINIAMSGFFIPTKDLVSMGTVVQVHVSHSDKKVQARGVVVLESTADGRMQTMGFGVRMERLSVEDLTWLKEKVSALRPRGR